MGYSIYFVVDNKLSTKVQIYIRGSLPNVHNNFGGFETVDAGERKQLGHSDSRGWLSTRYGYEGQIRVWSDTLYNGKVVGQAFGLMHTKGSNGKWDIWFEIDLQNFKDAPGGNITVTLTAKAVAEDGNLAHLTMPISASL